jgi:glycerophosphoryl diester phosphodiesterase
MRSTVRLVSVCLLTLIGAELAAAQPAVSLGPRPFYLIDDLDSTNADQAWLKQTLQACAGGPFEPSEFSIGHRGAAMQFPEHTRESYVAAARAGAGIIECDVTFTKDRQLVCRHSQCDLHTTTDILARPELAAKCSEPFVPADPATGTPASARCCTSDITLAEFQQLCGKMDGADSSATTVEEYLAGTPDWRTDRYNQCATLMTHAESIDLIGGLGAKFTPELKSPSVEMPFQGDYTQQMYAQQMIDEYKRAGIAPEDVWAQSFSLDDVLYWIENEPAFGEQAVYLIGTDAPGDAVYNETVSGMANLAALGVNIIAPPMWALVALDGRGWMVPSDMTLAAHANGMDLITWTLERSGLLETGGGWYYQTVSDAITREGDTLMMLHFLTWDVGVLGVFSDWPATVTYYANCFGL